MSRVFNLENYLEPLKTLNFLGENLNFGAKVCDIQAGRHFDFGMRNWSIIVETQTACSINEHGRVDFLRMYVN